MIINKIKNKNRTDLAIMFGQLGFEKGAEIGVRRGEYSEVLCLRIKSLKKLYSVDPWDLVYKDPRSHSEGITRQESYYQQAIARLSKYPVCEIIKKTSLEAVRDIPYESLDFVYIDGSHTFDYVMTDIIEWSKRVKRGGIVSGDDYKHHRYGDVITPVNAYVQAHRIETLNIFEPLETDSYPTPQWWFVKQ
ncbi:MAG: hypothetical protein A3C30_03110 [Candidatus Levybacteria bacterium RIFCSPHIGHO2_02_FULL_40_18]|nr:MAG: hypothetical protein A2869_04860 [Candidatus Levybacteria bacterium RIFCSPHIGHO2_01_FULL_40_58]OGH26542.1 MAG: hypothetical protein A3C30_03110 [Candidatus Levybacteria bacterium RIFCSPHIGHO2_02_FULL_40_18]OGH31531.1 MAG: hypothetical protein A3E43_02200 [Candidatus Levybacteria bacterium RIFCSPHIGHO2_12_FULL_40_31]OGH40296.1 MAG: hypothetical protein A2894_00750 [Candidatus Levybacteria bacterium RIFCSPLOWO2_01_FULL_40_64]OGH49500.1 MAG: hypothetical protein A3I54_03160 [Candidatus Lev